MQLLTPPPPGAYLASPASSHEFVFASVLIVTAALSVTPSTLLVRYPKLATRVSQGKGLTAATPRGWGVWLRFQG